MEHHLDTILIIEDDTGLCELVAEKIEENGLKTVCAHSASQAIEWLSANVPVLAVLDYNLPEMNGKQLINELKKLKSDVPPFIVATGQGDERVAVEMMKLGARDYIIKDRNFLDMIPIVVLRVEREIVNENKLKVAQATLRQREAYLSAIIENHPGLVCLKDTEGRILMANKGFILFWGYNTANSVYGKHASDILPKGIAEKDISDDFMVIKKREAVVSEMPIYHNNTTKWFMWYKAPIFNGGGAVAGTVSIAIDITERKKAEESLKENEARLTELNADKDRFLSILAHDLKGPFNVVLGLSEVLLDQVRSNNLNGIERYAETIKDSSQQVMDLLTNLIEWSRSQTGRMAFSPEEFNATQLINEIIHLFSEFAAQKSITLKTEMPQQHNLFADKAMVSTVLRNFVSNALKFTPTGGSITIAVEIRQSETFFQVIDSGVGISKTVVKKLFRIDENYTTPGTQNEQGTGLGLILCKEFVEKHKGKIGVDSEEGKGSTFWFSMPL